MRIRQHVFPESSVMTPSPLKTSPSVVIIKIYIEIIIRLVYFNYIPDDLITTSL